MKYREYDYGKLIYDSKKFQSDNYRYEVLILSKYLRHVVGMKKRDHIDFVYAICRECIVDFNEVLHGDMIDSSITKGRNKSSVPIQLDFIPIQNTEIEFISGLVMGDNEKRLLLALLCHRKLANEVNRIIKKDDALPLSKHINGSRKVYSKIKTMACAKGNFDIYESMRILQENGLITSTYDARLYLNFIDLIENGDVIYNLSYKNFDNCGLYYDFHNSIGVIECSECSVLIRKRNNKMSNCRECSKNLWNKYNAKKQREYRANAKRV